jgi:nucleoside-diphosphate-sugar epimerase
MKAFVTGGSGFVGRHLVRKLVRRGYDVYALTRLDSSAVELSALGAVPVRGSINDVESMRPDMTGADVVFHCAGWNKFGAKEWMAAESINVAGTRQVLRLAIELEVPKIIYTSAAVIYGDTGGQLVDETYYRSGPFSSEFERTKWLAHYKVALPLMEKGAPVSVAVPGFLYGPGDEGLIGDLMRAFFTGSLVAVPAPEFTISYVHVEDVADGLVRILEQGENGESYNLAGPAIPLGEMVDFWAQITGRPAPRISIPARLIKPFASVFEAARGFLFLPELLSQEGIDLINSSSMLRSDKAKDQLGWRTRTLQEGMVETFRWIDETASSKPDYSILHLVAN